jgi:hypothetical protein
MPPRLTCEQDICTLLVGEHCCLALSQIGCCLFSKCGSCALVRAADSSAPKDWRGRSANFVEKKRCYQALSLITVRWMTVKGLRFARERQTIAQKWFLSFVKIVNQKKRVRYQPLSKNGVITAELWRNSLSSKGLCERREVAKKVINSSAKGS